LETTSYYFIDEVQATDFKDVAKTAFLQHKKVVKVVRIQYETGPTKVIVTTLTDIKNVKDL
jgi:hypothetical protein